MSDAFANLSPEDLNTLIQQLERDYDLMGGNRLSLDLTRGKPAADQLALSDGLDDAIGGNYHSANNTDTRNYGGLRGISEARELGAQIMGVPADEVMAVGNSSLSLMYLTVATALRHGLWGDARRWQNVAKPALITPVPGYDRHFTLTASFDLNMVNVAMTDSGPDMKATEALVRDNPEIKGIWCVPRYANPTGCVYSDNTVARMAELPNVAAADDFVVLWDNAYAVHDLYFDGNPGQPLASLRDASAAAGTLDHVVQFASTSKITYASGGLGFVAAGESLLQALEARMALFSIGPDKVNQLRHARFLGGRLESHMRAHADLIRPKFEAVLSTLDRELGPLDIARWTSPQGGYFVSLDVQRGLATEVIRLAREVGLKLTAAGATFPNGADPDDSNVRIAPTFATLAELNTAMDVLVLCVKLATARKMLIEVPK